MFKMEYRPSLRLCLLLLLSMGVSVSRLYSTTKSQYSEDQKKVSKHLDTDGRQDGVCTVSRAK